VLLKKYIPQPIYNSDDVVMSRENRNFHLHLFVKGGALQTVTICSDGRIKSTNSLTTTRHRCINVFAWPLSTWRARRWSGFKMPMKQDNSDVGHLLTGPAHSFWSCV
jgi:hypothetical protein